MDDNHLVRAVREHEASLSTVQPCSLPDYRMYTGHLPRPSGEQIDNFVSFVAQAHSWYKHLPLLPPGEPFHFFLDPFSGYDQIVQHGGDILLTERTDTSQRFHYTWMTTKEYRARFGYLAYECAAGSQFYVQSDTAVWVYAALPIFYTAGGAYHIPEEIAEAGTVELTAIVHPKTAELWHVAEVMHIRAGKSLEDGSRQWPAETGGEGTFRKIREALNDPVERSLSEIAERIDALLLPERRRLQENMVQAIQYMLELVYE